MLQRLSTGGDELPAARIHPVGELVWFVDTAAAGSAPP
jgi:hypothetical protein